MSRERRQRLDQLLVDRGLAPSRSRAQALVLGGLVRVGVGDGARATHKPGDLLDPTVEVRVTQPPAYVSRGGDKLSHALAAFGVDPAGRTCLDVGASTGGFTDVLLQGGALRVHAVDVGRGQLSESLRRDPRVVSRERTNARDLEPGLLGELASLATIDVSFISLRLVLGPIASCLTPDGEVVALVKPQFEAGRELVPRGVVRDPVVHAAVLRSVAAAALACRLDVLGVCASPLLGPAGNREFFLHLRRSARDGALPPGWDDLVDRTVAG